MGLRTQRYDVMVRGGKDLTDAGVQRLFMRRIMSFEEQQHSGLIPQRLKRTVRNLQQIVDGRIGKQQSFEQLPAQSETSGSVTTTGQQDQTLQLSMRKQHCLRSLRKLLLIEIGKGLQSADGNASYDRSGKRLYRRTDHTQKDS